MANSAGTVGAPNEGSTTDMDRGMSFKFPYTKADRKTGQVGGATAVPNPVTVDGNKSVSNDPRLVKD